MPKAQAIQINCENTLMICYAVLDTIDQRFRQVDTQRQQILHYAYESRGKNGCTITGDNVIQDSRQRRTQMVSASWQHSMKVTSANVEEFSVPVERQQQVLVV